MSNPTQEYNDYIRSNLPLGITYDEDRARYVTENGKYFPTYLEAKWYLDYIKKFGFIPIPESLFANGEQGAWYDPSDLTTLYQDAAGTTPVTADGDPVGLMLDKHLGGTFEARRNSLKYTEQIDSSYWVNKSGTFIADDESDPNGNITAEKHVPGTTDNYWRFRGLIDVEAGKSYTASVYVKSSGYNFYQIRFERSGFGSDIHQNFDINAGTIESASSGIVKATIEDAGGGWFRCSATAEAVDSIETGINFVVINSATAGDLERFVGDGTSGVYVWGVQFEEGSTATDYQPVEEYPTAWPNGNHATQSTAAARPVYRTNGTLHWLEFDGVDDFLEFPGFQSFVGGENVWVATQPTFDVNSTNSEFYTILAVKGGGTSFNDPSGVRFAYKVSREPPPVGETVLGWGAAAGEGDQLSPFLSPAEKSVVHWVQKVGTDTRYNGDIYLTEATPDYDNDTMTDARIGGSGSSGGFGKFNLYGFVIRSSFSSVLDVSTTEKYLASKSGVTL